MSALRWRFNRRGEVIPDERRMSALYNTDAYRQGDRLFQPRRCSPARYRFRAASRPANGGAA